MQDTQAKPKEIFISYRSTEREAVEALIVVLRQTGDYDPWYDKKIAGGQNWWDTILDHIESAEIVILALSSAYLKRNACKQEMDYALRLGKAILPIVVDPNMQFAELGKKLRERQILRFDPASLNQEALFTAMRSVRPTAPAANVSRPAVPMSQLAELQDIVDSPEELTGDEQRNTVNALRWHVRQRPHDADRVVELLERLKARSEITVQVSQEVDDSIANLHPAEEGAPAQDLEQAPETTKSTESQTRQLPSLWILIVAVIVIMLALIFVSLNGANPGGSTSTPTVMADSPTTSSSTTTHSSSQVAINAPAAAGAFDLTLIYGAHNSFTVLINGESHLYELVLESSELVETISQSFDSLAVTGFEAASGTCLRYVREGTQPALPRGCNPDSTYEQVLPDADVFWFDDSSNQFRDIALKQSGTLIGLCPNAGGSGRCNFSG